MRFLDTCEILAIQARLIAAFGGVPGLRGTGALDAGLAAVRQRVVYGQADLVTCAATYASHLSHAHAFIDGNKRLAAAVAEIFLELQGAVLEADNDALVAMSLALAAGQRTRDEVEAWFLQSVAPPAARRPRPQQAGGGAPGQGNESASRIF